ncbi:hypothetical protein ACXYRQ_00620 [Mycoplasma sp. 394]
MVSINRQITNKIYWFIAVFVLFFGSQGFQIGASVYIFQSLNNLWYITLYYILIQVPMIFVFIFGPKIIKLFKSKNILIFSDSASIFILLIVLIIAFKTHDKALSYSLIVASGLFSIVNSFRILAFKNIVYYLANQSKELPIFNITNALAIAISTFISPLFTLFLFKWPFFAVVIFNIITFAISLFFFILLKPNQHSLKLVEEHTQDKIAKIKYEKWIFALSLGLFFSIFLFPKQTGILQFFNYIKYDYKKWSFLFSMIIGGSALLGTGAILGYITAKKKVSRNRLFMGLTIVASLLNLIWIPILFAVKEDKLALLITYIILNSFMQLSQSLLFPIGNNYLYLIFDKNEFNKQNAVTLIIRIIFYCLILVIFTWLDDSYGFEYMFILYAILFFIILIAMVISRYRIHKKIHH